MNDSTARNLVILGFSVVGLILAVVACFSYGPVIADAMTKLHSIPRFG